MLSKLLWFIGATVGGAIGWWIGEFFGTFAAFVISTIGTGIGVYWARRYVAEHF